ncbi:hypothetical protein [Thermostichus sp. MS-CIW-34]
MEIFPLLRSKGGIGIPLDGVAVGWLPMPLVWGSQMTRSPSLYLEWFVAAKPL